MLVLTETAAGFAIFKVLSEKKLMKHQNNLAQLFQNEDKLKKIIELQRFKKFADSTEALTANLALNESKMCKPLKKLLNKVYTEENEKLLVIDPKLGASIHEKFKFDIETTGIVGELMRSIRFNIESLVPGLDGKELTAMSLGLAHNLSRYKIKFSPDKVDTMIVQAMSLLDDLDKEINKYNMRVREWYGWHFPELGKIVPDHYNYICTVILMGLKETACNAEFPDALPEDDVARIKEAAEMSMGTQIAEDDIQNIQWLCEEIKGMMEYRGELAKYLQSRMEAIAPALSILVGEFVGARLISHAGSLMNLAKHPASTIQILGAEKALFSALKKRKNTPKYGLIYHAQLVSQTSQRNKGKMSRMLAAKAALAIRCDALGENACYKDFALKNKGKLSARMSSIESGEDNRISGRGRSQHKFDSYNRSNYDRQDKRKGFSQYGNQQKRFKGE